MSGRGTVPPIRIGTTTTRKNIFTFTYIPYHMRYDMISNIISYLTHTTQHRRGSHSISYACNPTQQAREGVWGKLGMHNIFIYHIPGYIYIHTRTNIRDRARESMFDLSLSTVRNLTESIRTRDTRDRHIRDKEPFKNSSLQNFK